MRLSYCFSLLTSAMKSLSPLRCVGVDVVVSEGHLERVESQVMSAPFLSPRGEGRLDHLHRVLGKSAVADSAAPFAYANLVTDFAAFLQRVQHGTSQTRGAVCSLRRFRCCRNR